MEQKVLLIANLGSPDLPETPALKRYLGEFLMDKYVIDIPYLLRYLLVKGIIVPFRASKSAEKYKTVWTPQGSPLLVNTKKLADKLITNANIPVFYCMRYGHPGPDKVLESIYQSYPNATEVIVFPMYPHYAMSSYKTAVEHIETAFKKSKLKATLNVVKPFYKHPDYIAALTESIAKNLSSDVDHLLFSYHGLPERHILKTDCTGQHCLKTENCCRVESEAHQFCYRHQVFETSRLVAQRLNIPEDKYSICFQSRLGKDKWLDPETTRVLSELPKKGKKKIAVVCPAFTADCLETLEEIMIEGKDLFLEQGGQSFQYIPCLNDNDDWAEAVLKISKIK